jgi:hypothetical protein
MAPEGAGRPAAGLGRGPSRRDWPTPTRLWASLAVAVIALVSVGAGSAAALSARQATETHDAIFAEHLLVNVDELYHSLADADATAATALMIGPVAPARLTGQYDADIAQAENALAAASHDLAGDEAASTLLAKVAGQLPTYTALIATADADNRLGFPLGAAYLREGSGLLRHSILTEVGSVADRERASQNVAQDGVTGFPLEPVLVGLLAAALLVLVWRELSRTTRRSFNPGLAAGSLIGLGLVAWTLTAFLVAAGDSRTAKADFSGVDVVLQARNNLALTQSEQSLELIDRGSDNGQDARDLDITLLKAVDSGGLDAESERLGEGFSNSVGLVSQDVARGDYHGGVLHAAGNGAGPTTTIAQARTLDDALVRLYNARQDQYTRDSGSAGSDLSGGLWGGVLGGLAAASAAAYGINRRLAEYR